MKNQTFLDGQLDVWEEKNEDFRRKYKNVFFETRVVGSKRAFEAMQTGHTIQKVVRVPLYGIAWNALKISIGSQQYDILQAQELPDTCPKCTQLTLELPDIAWALSLEGDHGCTECC